MKIWQVGAIIGGLPVYKLNLEKNQSADFMEIDLQGGFISAIQDLANYLYHEDVQFIRLKHFAICTQSIMIKKQIITLYLITNQKKFSLKCSFYRLNRLAIDLKPINRSLSLIHTSDNNFLEPYFKKEFLYRNIPFIDLVKLFIKRYDL